MHARSTTTRPDLDLGPHSRWLSVTYNSELRLPFLAGLLRWPKERREHLLQTLDEDVGLTIALQHGSDLLILQGDLAVFDFELLAIEFAIIVELFDFPLKPLDILRHHRLL